MGKAQLDSQMSRMFKLKAEKNVTKELKKGRENGD